MSEALERTPILSYNACRVMELLLHCGGGIRIGPLLRGSGLSHNNLVLGINELYERWYIEIIWRGPAAHRPGTIPERFRDVRRVATTRTGRHCYPLAPRF